MFDRYADEAKRALLFARRSVAEYGGTQIESERLLLGVLLADATTLRRLGVAEENRASRPGSADPGAAWRSILARKPRVRPLELVIRLKSCPPGRWAFLAPIGASRDRRT